MQLRRLPPASRMQRQRGAALFVSLMILILLSLLAVSASQVTALQERMVQAYWADVRAFDGAEERLRASERELRAQVAMEECPFVDESAPPAWVNPNVRPSAAGAHLTNLSQIRGSGLASSAAMGPSGAVQCLFIQISASESDSRIDDDARSWSVVQSIFVP